MTEEQNLNSHPYATELLWCIDFEEPISLDLPESEQIEHIFQARVVEANLAFAHSYGATLEEVLQWRVEDFIPRSFPTTIPNFRRIIRAGYNLDRIETTERAVDGRTKTFVNSFVGTIKHGKVLRLWGVARDITEQREIEQQVRLQRIAIERASDGFLIADARKDDYPIIYANASFLKMSGYSENEVLGRNCRFLQGKGTDRNTVREIRNAIKNGKRFAGELLNYRKNREPFWNYLRLSPVIDSDGELTHFVGIQSDVTQRKRSEEIIAQQKSELIQASRIAMLAEVGATVGHELNQPMAAILFNAESARQIIQDKDPNLEELDRIILDIIRDDRRAGKVLERIRYHMQKTAYPHQPVDLNLIVKESFVLLDNDLSSQHIKTERNLAHDLPACMGDPIEIQQVLVNLVLNSMQAMIDQEGNRELSVTTSPDSKGNIQIIVEDNGPGIHERDLERVFNAFHSTKPEGMGIGLAINRTIINAHGGRIWAEQREPMGTRMVVTLPPIQHESDNEPEGN